MLLLNSMAVLISLKQSLPKVGLINAAESSTAMIIEINDWFQNTTILYRVGVLNVYSDSSDERNRVFTQGMCSMGWGTRYRCLASPNGHLSLLCGQGIGETSFFELVKEHVPFRSELEPTPLRLTNLSDCY